MYLDRIVGGSMFPISIKEPCGEVIWLTPPVHIFRFVGVSLPASDKQDWCLVASPISYPSRLGPCLLWNWALFPFRIFVSRGFHYDAQYASDGYAGSEFVPTKCFPDWIPFSWVPHASRSLTACLPGAWTSSFILMCILSHHGEPPLVDVN